MTAAIEPNPQAVRPELTGGDSGGPSRFGGRRHGTTSLRVGAASIWLSVIVQEFRDVLGLLVFQQGRQQ